MPTFKRFFGEMLQKYRNIVSTSELVNEALVPLLSGDEVKTGYLYENLCTISGGLPYPAMRSLLLLKIWGQVWLKSIDLSVHTRAASMCI
jgi:hypothetical protein